MRNGPLEPNCAAVRERFATFSLGGEVFSTEFPLVVFHVSADAALPQIKALLVHGEEQGWWSFEVGCGTDAWRNA
jgi:hypothetical protein